VNSTDPAHLTRELLLSYFHQGAVPVERFRVGMEVERLGRQAHTGRPLPYDGSAASVRAVLERLTAEREGKPVLEDGRIIGAETAWGTLSIEPGGQVEWSSIPCATLEDLGRLLTHHQASMREAGAALGVEWLETGLDPDHAVGQMPWMPKARYALMREHLGRTGRLAHRMMTQTASIQCAFDYRDATDWARKFRATANLTPVAVALFANSAHADGRDTGWRSFRQAIWRETDPDRCGLPAVVFAPDFGVERWLDWLLDVPLLFRRGSAGLYAARGERFRELLALQARSPLQREDWETHLSTIFTEVRSYHYIEVRSADLLPDALALAVPAFWTGTLHDEEALDLALASGAGLDHAAWLAGLGSAARDGLAGSVAGRPLGQAAVDALRAAARGLRRAARLVGDPSAPLAALDALARRHDLTLDA